MAKENQKLSDKKISRLEMIWATLIIRYVVGIAVILVISSFFEPLTTFPLGTEFFSTMYDQGILFATRASGLIIDVVIVWATLTFGGYGFKAIRCIASYLMTLLEIIQERREEKQ